MKKKFEIQIKAAERAIIKAKVMEITMAKAEAGNLMLEKGIREAK